MNQGLLIFLIILIVIGLFIIYFLLSNKQTSTVNKYVLNRNVVVPTHRCKNTRYGCCHDGITTK